MVYPENPFSNKFDTATIFQSSHSENSADTDEVTIDENKKNILKWLCVTPTITTYRVNNNTNTSIQQIKNIIENILKQEAIKRNFVDFPQISIHPKLPEVIMIKSWPVNVLDLSKKDREIVIDATCGAAVLRGAHVYAPGVMAMQTGTKHDDIVSVYADVSKKCKRGLPCLYDCPHKVFVGNGRVRMVRSEIFGQNLKLSGVAVKMTDILSGCPTLNESSLPTGSAILQNLPSVVCGHVLNPQANDTVLDMCAAPGNKTTHLAARMKNQGILIAIDKTPNKVQQLIKRCAEYSANCVKIYQFDSTQACDESLEKSDGYLSKGPPFPKETFDKILLDTPCSGLGNRPQLSNTITDKIVKSYVPLQRKLMKNAVKLLKIGGHLVYSTCSITLRENEEIVSWALETFKCLELVSAEPMLGGPAWPGSKLTEHECKLVQRFGPNQTYDTVGFFIAHYVKTTK